MKNNITLDLRLETIAKYVNKCHKVADIGTDHGLIPIYLILNGICDKVFACDIAKQPLTKAKENIIKYHLEDKITTFLTNGLNNLPKDIDVIVIAGMGGHLVSSILEDNDFKYNTLVLQANNHNDVLRKTLMNLNYEIVNEDIVFSKGKFYEIIIANLNENKVELSNDEIKYGPINLTKKNDAFIKMYHEKLLTLENILNSNKLNIEKENELKIEINNLKEILK